MVMHPQTVGAHFSYASNDLQLNFQSLVIADWVPVSKLHNQKFRWKKQEITETKRGLFRGLIF